MIQFAKACLRRIYWIVLNRIKNHQVESSSVALKARVGRKVIIRAGSEVGPGVAIGDYSYISGPMAYVEAAEIGKFCSIARQTVIGVSGHDYRLVTTHPFILDPRYGIASRKRREEQKPPPVIGHDVWIGINAVIHRGVRIGIGAVVASNAVVTKDVAPYSIVGGNPAKHIKYRFSDDLIQALLASEWWNWSDEKLASLAEDFLDPDVFAQKHAGNQDSPMGVEFARGE